MINLRSNRHRSWANDEENEGRDWDLDHTEAIFDEVIEGVAVTVVGELLVGSRKLLEALGNDAREISGELERERASEREKCLEAKKIKENENSETLKCWGFFFGFSMGRAELNLGILFLG